MTGYRTRHNLRFSCIRYLKQLFFSVLALALSAFSINLIIDPFWFNSGNLLQGMNYAFNERISKMNRWMQHPESYDCLIFGSSRATLLNERRIRGWNCYNFAFSGGLAGDILFYARYLKERGANPGLVIIGVDRENFFVAEPLDEVPDFIRNGTAPPGLLRTYLSLDSLDFSIRALKGISALPRYYRSDFTADVLADAPTYIPGTGPADRAVFGVFSLRSRDYYREIRDIFPNAHTVAFIPPISAWAVNNLKKQDLLHDYLDAMYATSKLFQPFYDFAIPSSVTSSDNNTYDGSHYGLEVNSMIADTLSTGESTFGIRVDLIDREEYGDMYQEALDLFRKRLLATR